MYRGDGDGGWLTGKGEQIGSGWQGFSAILAGGDFSGDGKPDVLAVNPAGALFMYRGNGAGGWVLGSGEQVGGGWAGFTALAVRRRLLRRRQARRPRPYARRRAAALPRQRRGRLGHRPGRADRLGLERALAT